MVRRIMIAGLLLVFAGVADAKDEPKYDMGVMQAIFLVKTPHPGLSAADSVKAMKAHRAAVDSLMSRGTIAFSGVGAPDDTLQEIIVVKADTVLAAEHLARDFPAVKAGLVEARHLGWYAARNILTPAAKPFSRRDYIFGILVRGSKWTPGETEETKKIQEGHLANIGRLADLGKLVLAGPFENGGLERGVFIFKVPTLAEAQELTDTDPAVKAGRLRIVLHPVSVPVGVLP